MLLVSLPVYGLLWESYTLAETKSGDGADDFGDGPEKKGVNRKEYTQR